MTNMVDETQEIEEIDIDGIEGETIDLDMPGLGEENISKRALKDGLGLTEDDLADIAPPGAVGNKSMLDNREFAAEINRIRTEDAPFMSKEELNEAIAQAYINNDREVPARYLTVSETPSP